MNIFEKNSRLLSAWWYRVTHFEFFRMSALYLPVFIYYLFVALRLKKLHWISYINPHIPYSGFKPHSKYRLLKFLASENQIPQVLISKDTSYENLQLQISKCSFPLIVKPDDGYRGKGVHKVHSFEDMKNLHDHKHDLLVQEFVNSQREYAIFYTRFPEDEKGTVVMLTEKKFIEVIGNGQDRLDTLILKHERGRLYYKKILKRLTQKEHSLVLKRNEKRQLGYIGSHNQGSLFLERSEHITENFSEYIDMITKEIPDFYYGRYDVKADSLEALLSGSFKVVELNAAVAEPISMYDPRTKIIQGYRILLTFWSYMARIAKENIYKEKTT